MSWSKDLQKRAAELGIENPAGYTDELLGQLVVNLLDRVAALEAQLGKDAAVRRGAVAALRGNAPAADGEA